MENQLQELSLEREMNTLREASLKKEEVRLTPMELAQVLSKEGKFELTSNKILILSQMDVSDFLTAVTTTDLTERLQVLAKILSRFSLDIILEGSVTLGEFNIADHSWSMSAGSSGIMLIKAKPTLVRRSVSEIVSFLNMLPVGQGFVLKGSQDLLIEGLSSDSMLEYYKFCQDNGDPKARDMGQDALFEKNCQTLSFKGLSLKVFGLNASQVDRGIDVNAGGILFRAVPAELSQKSAIVVVLLAKETKS